MYRNQAFKTSQLLDLPKPNRTQGRTDHPGRALYNQTNLPKANEKKKLNATQDSQILGNPSRLELKKVFMVMSRIHNHFKLRYQTLFLAVELYLKYYELVQPANEGSNPEQNSVPESCLILVCMFLSIKYEQIYPPRLKCLFPYVKVELTLREYRVYEAKVLTRLGGSLDLKTARDILEEQLRDSEEEVYHMAYYFLEMAYLKDLVINYTLETICKSILYLIQPLKKEKTREGKGINTSDILMCSKQLIQTWTYQTQNDTNLNRKYAQSRYLKVSQRPWLSLKRDL